MKNSFFQIIRQKNQEESGMKLYIGKMLISELYSIHRVSSLRETDFTDFENSSLTEQVGRAINYDSDAKQREESGKKINSISKYIDIDNGIFPNAIILGNSDSSGAIKLKKIKDFDLYELETNITNNGQKLFVIDGQHRLKGVAFNYYSQIFLEISSLFGEGENYKSLFKKIASLKSPSEKTIQIIKLLEKVNKEGGQLSEKVDEIIKKVDEFELPVVIIDKISNSKIIEIFTDINGLVTPLDSNIIRFYYGWFTTKHINRPDKKDSYKLLNVSVNLAKLLHENQSSALHGLVKMPYKSIYSKGFSQVSISAFCQRFEERSRLEIVIKNNFAGVFDKTIGIFIYHWQVAGLIEQFSPYTEETLVKSINFLFLVFSYFYIEAKKVFDAIFIDNKGYDLKEQKKYKFIDSTSNELYFYAISYVIGMMIESNKYDIEKMLKLEKDDIKEGVGKEFKKIKSALRAFYEDNGEYFTKGFSKTGGGASKDLMKIFRKSLESTGILDRKRVDTFEMGVQQYYENFRNSHIK